MRRQELFWYAIALDILLFNLKCRLNLEIECSTWNKGASLKSILPLRENVSFFCSQQSWGKEFL